MLVLVGESGSGKSTLETLIANNTHLSKAISYTTRPLRKGEVNGIDYHFVSDEEFERLIEVDIFVEHEEYRGWKYGLAKEDCTANKVAVLTPGGLRQLKNYIYTNNPTLPLTSIYINVDKKSRLDMLLSSRDDEVECRRRVESDEELFKDIELEVNVTLNNYQYEYMPEELFFVIDKFILGRTIL